MAYKNFYQLGSLNKDLVIDPKLLAFRNAVDSAINGASVVSQAAASYAKQYSVVEKQEVDSDGHVTDTTSTPRRSVALYDISDTIRRTKQVSANIDQYLETFKGGQVTTPVQLLDTYTVQGPSAAFPLRLNLRANTSPTTGSMQASVGCLEAYLVTTSYTGYDELSVYMNYTGTGNVSGTTEGGFMGNVPIHHRAYYTDDQNVNQDVIFTQVELGKVFATNFGFVRIGVDLGLHHISSPDNSSSALYRVRLEVTNPRGTTSKVYVSAWNDSVNHSSDTASICKIAATTGEATLNSSELSVIADTFICSNFQGNSQRMEMVEGYPVNMRSEPSYLAWTGANAPSTNAYGDPVTRDNADMKSVLDYLIDMFPDFSAITAELESLYSSGE